MDAKQAALEKFGALMDEQLARIEKMKAEKDFLDYSALKPIIIGICGGDGIGPAITHQARRILEVLLQDEIASGKVELRDIDGLTIERRAAVGKGIPDDTLEELKACHVILKGPTTTPRAGDPWPNVESANVGMRKALDLFANVRPVCIPEQGIDWTFFRENTEGAYTVGGKGFAYNEDLFVDFTITTREGTERIIRSAFEFAKKNGKTRVIITDEAAELQGGVGTAGSSNIGKRYAMFEAIHGSAPRMVAEGRDIYADPTSVIRAAGMLLAHIGYTEQAKKLDAALDICTRTEKKVFTTGRSNGATGEQVADYILETIAKL